MKLEKIKLVFEDKQSKARTLTVDYPKDQLTGTEVNTAMDAIISSKVLLGKETILSDKVKAYQEKIERNEFSVE